MNLNNKDVGPYVEDKNSNESWACSTLERVWCRTCHRDEEVGNKGKEYLVEYILDVRA